MTSQDTTLERFLVKSDRFNGQEERPNKYLSSPLISSIKNEKALKAKHIFFEDPDVRIRSDSLIFPEINHGFFTRKGGVSQASYQSLNCGFGTKEDERERVVQNRAFVMGTLNLACDRLVTPYQVHGNLVHTINAPVPDDQSLEGDALVTREKNIALGILTADCAPLLLADHQAGVIAAAHAGWRGAKANILAKTVKAMVKIGAQKPHISLAIGPCISQANYEIGDVFYNDFIAHDAANKDYFHKNIKTDKYHFDLPGFIVAQAKALEINTIHNLGLCTYADKERFFSCRRAFHEKERDYGRMISCIVIGPVQAK